MNDPWKWVEYFCVLGIGFILGFAVGLLAAGVE